MSTAKRRSRRHLAVVLTVCAVGFSACRSVNQEAFGEFASTLRTWRDAAALEVQADVTKSQTRFVDEVVAGEKRLTALQFNWVENRPFALKYAGEPDRAPEALLDQEEENLANEDEETRQTLAEADEILASDAVAQVLEAPREGEPLFVKLGRFQRGLNALNDSMVGYAEALAKLAGPETANQQQFDDLTRSVNTSATEAADALGVTLPDKAGLLATGAVKIFQLIIEKKRRDSLQSSINANTGVVQSFSTSATLAVELLATGVKQAYTREFRELFRAYLLKLKDFRDGSGDEKNVRGAVTAVLDHNQATENNLARLQALHDGFSKLPLAHESLLEAANTKRPGLSGVVAFTDEVLRLKALSASL